METRGKKRDGSGKAATLASPLEDEGPSPQQETEAVVQQAFAQALLLEMILDYGMRDKAGKLCPENIKNLRLVQKSWKKAVSKKLWDNKEPLYRLKLDKNNSLISAKCVKKDGKLLDGFVDYWTTGKGGKEGMPTFRMQLDEDYFRHENYNSLLNCLRKCGAGLVEIEMNVPENGGSLTGMLPGVVLPALQKLTIVLINSPLENIEGSEVNVDHASNITNLFQSLLNRNESLKELVFDADTWKFHSFPGLQFTLLPESCINCSVQK